MWYVFRFFRAVHGQGRFRTTAKIVLLGITHLLLLVFMAVALVWATVAWLAYD